MNEYTRREEIRWTLVTVGILVPAVAIAVWRLATVEGPLVPNPASVQAAEQASKRASGYRSCTKAAEKLSKEVPTFQAMAEVAKREAAEAREARERDRRRRRDDDEEPIEVRIPWSAAQLVYLPAKNLAPCREQTAAAAGARSEADGAWKAVTAAAALAPPERGDHEQEAEAAKKLLEVFDKDLPLDALVTHTADAQKQLEDEADKKRKIAATDKVHQPIPDGLFPRGVAIGVGVGVALAALLISYISVRSASRRRARALIGVRRFANTPEAGFQAATIVRLAAHHNGGEPGMVLGAALGGLVAAIAVPLLGHDLFVGDLFVAGAMGGLLLGLAAQWLVRTLAGVAPWRKRTLELGSLEKPTIPLALVISGVRPGLEKQFLRYFEALGMADAAAVVEKLAAQAEERILAAAEAGAQQFAGAGEGGHWGGPAGQPAAPAGQGAAPAAATPTPGAYSPGGYPPGGGGAPPGGGPY